MSRSRYSPDRRPTWGRGGGGARSQYSPDRRPTWGRGGGGCAIAKKKKKRSSSSRTPWQRAADPRGSGDPTLRTTAIDDTSAGPFFGLGYTCRFNTTFIIRSRQDALTVRSGQSQIESCSHCDPMSYTTSQGGQAHILIGLHRCVDSNLGTMWEDYIIKTTHKAYTEPTRILPVCMLGIRYYAIFCTEDG